MTELSAQMIQTLEERHPGAPLGRALLLEFAYECKKHHQKDLLGYVALWFLAFGVSVVLLSGLWVWLMFPVYYVIGKRAYPASAGWFQSRLFIRELKAGKWDPPPGDLYFVNESHTVTKTGASGPGDRE